MTKSAKEVGVGSQAGSVVQCCHQGARIFLIFLLYHPCLFNVFWIIRWLCHMQVQPHPVKKKRTTSFFMCPFIRQENLSLKLSIRCLFQSYALALNAREAGKVAFLAFTIRGSTTRKRWQEQSLKKPGSEASYA